MNPTSQGVPEERTAQPTWAILLAAGCLVGAAIAFVSGGRALLERFPDSYTWTELLISYEAGFVRRGLLGEVASWFDPSLRIDRSIAFVVTVAYVALSSVTVVMTFRRVSFPGLLCLASPGLLLFPLWDFEAFGRKDVFILLAFVLALGCAHRLRGAWTAAATIAGVYTLAGLVHETAWIYFLVAIAALLLIRDDDPGEQGVLVVFALAYGLAGVVVTSLFGGSPAQADAMIDAWSERFATSYPDPGAARFLALPASASFGLVASHQRHLLTTAGYLAGFLLTAAPVVLLVRERWTAFRPTAWRRSVLWCGALAMLSAFAVAADWGRYSYLFWMHALLFFLAVRPLARDAERLRRPAAALGAMLLLVVYATAWHVLHFAEGGRNPLEPGPLLTMLLPWP